MRKMKTTILTFLTSAFKALLLFFAPISLGVVLVIVSVVLDTFFGRWRAKKMGEEITSKKSRNGFVGKTFVYCGAVLLVFTLDHFILNDLTKMLVDVKFISSRLMVLILVSIEVKSMDESWQSVKGWSFIDRTKKMVQKIKATKKELEE
jgi:cytochrome c biogenesis protein CcdA